MKINKGRVTADPLDATVFRNPQRSPAPTAIMISIGIYLIPALLVQVKKLIATAGHRFSLSASLVNKRVAKDIRAVAITKKN
ncbi:hypothetical protein [Polynucleobacter arcticus]|uniref:hypothetical protein n=1 Tax=Polynucleobacter arcticus TaxID=1743165 RepID=UPI0039EFA7DE